MTEYLIGPDRLGLVIQTGGDFVDIFAKDIYNGSPVSEKNKREKRRLTLLIETGTQESPFRKFENPNGLIGGIEYRFDGTRVRFESTALYGEIDFLSGYGEVTVTNVQSTDLDTLLRQVVFRLGAETNLLMLHSVCWVLGGYAFLSCGPAESGKSTIGRMLKDALPVLSDEFNFVECCTDGARVLRSPVRAIEPIKDLDESYPVRAILFHKKNDRPYIRPICSADALRELEKNVFAGVFATIDIKVAAFERASEIAENAAVFEIGVTLEKRGILRNIGKIERHLEGIV